MPDGDEAAPTGAERKMRKVLMIAYAFPPMGGSGVQRTLKFAKYLPDFGWEPIILTASQALMEQQGETDYSLLDDIPAAAAVHRIPDPRLRRFLSRRPNGPAMEFTDSRQLRRDGTGGYARALAKSLVFVPDAQIEWLPLALSEAISLVRRHKVDLIWSTSDPFTDHLVAYLLKRLGARPWVADFRDP